MQSYEVVREVENLCANNQMRDIFFEEIETDDPVGWLRDFVKGKDVDADGRRKGKRRSDGVCGERRRDAEISVHPAVTRASRKTAKKPDQN